MLLHESELFAVEYREKEKLFVPSWKGKELNAESFMKEMKQYMEVLRRTNATKVVWDQTQFTFQIPNTLYQWIEKEINEPAKKQGMNKIGFVISQDVMAQFSTMDVFESTQSVLVPRYFSNSEKALRWINEKEDEQVNPFSKEINLVVDKFLDKGKAQIKIEVDLEQLPFHMKVLKQYFDHHSFIHRNYLKYMRLTSREKEILSLMVSGASNKRIADCLFISLNTVTTHRKHIIKKLECRNMAELVKFNVLLNL